MSNPTTDLAPKKMSFSEYMGTENTQTFLMRTLGNERSVQRFGAAIISAVSINPALAGCVYSSIVAGALLGEALKLSPSPQLGQYYLVPFKQKAKNGQPECMKATFVCGYKGYIQLAMRSGMYREFNVVEIHEGELVKHDRLTDRIVIRDMPEEELEKAPVIGYYVMFELLNGFTKSMYWTKEKMMRHADRYSPAFSAKSYRDILDKKIPQSDMWKYSSFWYKEFDEMAKKTLIRQIISKWGVMSIDMQTAFETDEAIGVVSGNEIITEARDEIGEMDIAGALGEAATPDSQKEEVVNMDDL